MAYRKRKKNKGKKIALGVTSAILITGVAAGAMVALDRVQVSASDNKEETSNDELSSQISKLTADKVALEKQLAALTGDKTELTNKISTLDKQIETLEAEKKALEESTSDNAIQIESLNSEISKLNENRVSLESAINELETTIGENEETISYLLGQVDSLDQEIANLEEQKTVLENTNASNNAQIEDLNNQITNVETEKTTLEQQIESLTADINSLNSEIISLEGEVDSLTEEIKSLKANQTSITIANPVMDILAEDIAFIDYYNDDVTSVNGNGEEIDYSILYSPKSSYAVGDTQEVMYINGNEESNDYAKRVFNIIEGSPITIYENGEALPDVIYIDELKEFNYVNYSGISNLRLHNYGEELELVRVEYTEYRGNGNIGSTVLNEENPTYTMVEGYGYDLSFTFTIRIDNEDGTQIKNMTKTIKYLHNDSVRVAKASDDSLELVSAEFNQETSDFEITFNAFGDENVTYTITNANIIKAMNAAGYAPITSGNTLSDTTYVQTSINQNAMTGEKTINIKLTKTLDDGSTGTIEFALLTDSIADQYAEIQVA